VPLNPAAIALQCVNCGTEYPHGAVYYCRACTWPLTVRYQSDVGADGRPLSRSCLRQPFQGVGIGMGQGHTPLIPAHRLARHLGIGNIYLKLESSNPTGSFKDRPVFAGLQAALEFGGATVIVASTGNGAAAVAAYGARNGLRAILIVPSDTSDAKLAQALSYGATVYRLSGGNYSACFQLAREVAADGGIYNVTSTFINPYTVQGDKLVGNELYEELGTEAPTRVYVPVGAGPLLAGIHEGYLDYEPTQGHLPQMVAVQAAGNAPIASAYAASTAVAANPMPTTIAGGIADGLVGYTVDGEYTLRLVRQTGGCALAVPDEAIVAAQSLLSTFEGVLAEPAAAAALAGLIADHDNDTLPDSIRKVVMITGHGLKDLAHINTSAGRIHTIGTTDDARPRILADM